MPPSLDEWLPEGHLARFVAELVDEVLDLAPVLASYTEKRGYPPYDPRLMLRLLIYGYTTGVRSSRAIERKCVDDVAFRYLAAGQGPDYRSISRFRRRHLAALAGLLVQSLHLAQRLSMVKRGRVALDGTKLEACASKHKAMSYTRLIAGQERIEMEIADLEATAAGLLADAEQTDTAEDARKEEHGTDTFMATGRLAHDEQVSAAPRGRIPASATPRERMARKLRTKPGRAAYSRRKAIVEPVFGQIMTCQDGRELLLRGEDGARAEWRLLAACHDLRKVFRHAGTAGLAGARA